MKRFRFAIIFLVASFVSTSVAQTAAHPKPQRASDSAEPLIVDVHPSPYRSKIYPNTNISNQRFDMRDATLLDIISLAWDRRAETVLGGPSWIDFDRFDLTAKIDSLKVGKPISGANPAATGSGSQDSGPYPQIRPVLQQVLAQRFHLTYHTENKPLPGYVMTLAKSGAKLTEAKDATTATNCRSEQVKDTPGQFAITCTSLTMDRLISMFGGIYPHLVVDQTGLKKTYDLRLTLSLNNLRTRDEYVQAYTDAFEKQLGLVITAQDIPQPAMVVNHADRTPTPNDSDISKLIPPLPDLEFEVASIKLASPGEPQGMIRPLGSQLTFFNMSLQDLLVQAWDLPTGAMISNVESLPKQRYTILVKLPPDMDARSVWEDQDQVDRMLQKLLIDRFQIKYHWGQQTQDGWVLLAGTPKLKKADPNSRTYCKYGPPDGVKDMRSADAPFDNESHCQNVTMAQLADMLQNLAKSEIKNHVQDKTGLAGSYDVTFYYTSTRKLRTQVAAAAAAAQESGASSDPVAGMSISDAFRKELGLRLEKQPGTYPALVLDHINQAPTDN